MGGVLGTLALAHALYPLKPLSLLLVYVRVVCNDHEVHLLVVKGMKASLSYVHAFLPLVPFTLGRNRGVERGFGLHLAAHIGLYRLPSVVGECFELGLTHVTLIIVAILFWRLLAYCLALAYPLSYLVDLAH